MKRVLNYCHIFPIVIFNFFFFSSPQYQFSKHKIASSVALDIYVYIYGCVVYVIDLEQVGVDGGYDRRRLYGVVERWIDRVCSYFLRLRADRIIDLHMSGVTWWLRAKQLG